MSKAVLISIRPKWCQKIASGEKTIEVRKTKPKLETPFKCYIYCTQDKHLAFMQNQTGTNLIACMDVDAAIPVGGAIGNGKVIGEFTCDKIETVIWATYGKYAGLPFVAISGDEQGIKFTQYKEIKEYEKQTCLSENEIVSYLSRSKPRGRGGYLLHISDLRIYDTPKELSEFQSVCRVDFGCHACLHYDYAKMDCGEKAISRPPQSWCYVDDVQAK